MLTSYINEMLHLAVAPKGDASALSRDVVFHETLDLTEGMCPLCVQRLHLTVLT